MTNGLCFDLSRAVGFERFRARLSAIFLSLMHNAWGSVVKGLFKMSLNGLKLERDAAHVRCAEAGPPESHRAANPTSRTDSRVSVRQALAVLALQLIVTDRTGYGEPDYLLQTTVRLIMPGHVTVSSSNGYRPKTARRVSTNRIQTKCTSRDPMS